MKTIRLRAIEPEDLDLLYGIENDTRLWNVGTTNVPYSRYTLHDYIASSADDIYADRQVRMIVENEEGEAVGIADLMNFSPQHLRAEVGIVMMDGHRRKGYGTAAVEALCDYALRVLHLHQLYAIVAADNQQALELFSKAAFYRQSMLKDWLFDGHGYADALLLQRFL
jgi:diamine N-acetyltransferase